MVFLTLLLIPLTIAFFIFLIGKHKISLAEFLIQIAVQCAVAGACIGVMYHRNTSDTEVWNGRVSDKKREKVSCSHSYSCNCYTTCSGSGSNRSCTQHCSTCYEHSYDVDWAVYTTLKERLEIDRVNRQGTEEPKRWTNVKIGEPTSTAHSYTNYIKAAPDSLFRKQGSKDMTAKQLYPGKIYDYYKLDRVTGDFGLSMPDVKTWNQELSELNASLGHSKQVNAVVVITKAKDSKFGESLEQSWLGGKKNDVIAVIGVDETTKAISWVHVIAWTDATYMKVKLRDAILDAKTLDKDKIFAALYTNIDEFYIRKSMKDFEYLAASIVPSTTEWVVSMLIGILISIGLTIFFWHNDDLAFNFEQPNRRRYF